MKHFNTISRLIITSSLMLCANASMAQNARTVVLDVDAAATVSLVRIMASGNEQTVRSALQRMNTEPITFNRGSTQTTVVPGNVVTCDANMSIGSVHADTMGATPRTMRVFITGTVTQLANGICN